MSDDVRGPDENAIKAMHDALAQAAERGVAVAKASYNSHHKYRYASGEHILVAARDALAGSGLAVVPRGCRIAQVGELYVLEREFEVTHSGGASKLCQMSWPLEINKGKTPDKAAAGAETTSFAYFLRTLLRMPRLDEDDMDHDEQPRGRSSEARTRMPPPARAARPASRFDATLARIEAIDSSERFAAAENYVEECRAKLREGMLCELTFDEVERLAVALDAKR